MRYLDFDRLEGIDPAAFRARKPYPWSNPEGALTEAGFHELVETLPPLTQFERSSGKARKFGQRSHDRFVLEYRDDLRLSRPWRAFIAELRSERYLAALRRLTGTRSLALSFHWHYTPNGCSVSPHCDARRKLGSHIFYFNTEKDWDPAWGGATQVLDDGGRFDPRSAPAFSDFDRAITAESMGNRSLLFVRREHSWHGVQEIRCPAGRYRKVFIVVIERRRGIGRWRR